MKEGDSIGVVHRHEMSPADELGRCHPDWWMFCKVLLSCNSALRYGWYPLLSLMKTQTKRNGVGRSPAPQYERRFSK